MSETSSEAAAFRGEPYERPETPGFHGMLLTGGLFGQQIIVCIECAALISDTDNARLVHSGWHKKAQAVTQAVVEMAGLLDAK